MYKSKQQNNVLVTRIREKLNSSLECTQCFQKIEGWEEGKTDCLKRNYFKTQIYAKMWTEI